MKKLLPEDHPAIIFIVIGLVIIVLSFSALMSYSKPLKNNITKETAINIINDWQKKKGAYTKPYTDNDVILTLNDGRYVWKLCEENQELYVDTDTGTVITGEPE